MYIYKITVIPIQKVYIGLDTKPSYKQSRWKDHCKNSKHNPKSKLHKAINQYGVDNCTFEVLQDNFNSVVSLALAEIQFINQYDSYANGLNSTPGGDGLNTDMSTLTEEEISILRHALGERWRRYNKMRWDGTSKEERKLMTMQCHTEEARRSRSKTLQRYYAEVPGAKDKHSTAIKEWRKLNPELAREINVINGKKGAEKVSKKVTVELEDGTEKVYSSVSEFQRQTGLWMATLKIKSSRGEFHQGYKLKEIH